MNHQGSTADRQPAYNMRTYPQPTTYYMNNRECTIKDHRGGLHPTSLSGRSSMPITNNKWVDLTQPSQQVSMPPGYENTQVQVWMQGEMMHQ
mmetsp:Transcript_14037/g.30391  ORF Transcript_14037/g.30391 Transcript_14037/m.30391 type:complete len:92 (-) Transcript_14037:975-1250(-)